MTCETVDALLAKADSLVACGDADAAMRCCDEAVKKYCKTAGRKDMFRAAGVVGAVGKTLVEEGRVAEGRTRMEEAVRLKKKWFGGRGDAMSLAVSLHNLGEACLVLGEIGEGKAVLEESLYLAHKATGSLRGLTPHATLSALAKCHSRLGNPHITYKFQAKGTYYATDLYSTHPTRQTAAVVVKSLLAEASYALSASHALSCRIKADRIIKQSNLPESTWAATPLNPQLFDEAACVECCKKN
eukprot:TRINITY_DN26728_c0_g1_i1.p1 TRINITY_DN26728_c0_g1~~TRINITY_DN26728_c0_g1_i1.p1  ORF type:complete len:255 (+),score=22.46 TRINITY_DN26728_c0_g1_i1:38-766(+)